MKRRREDVLLETDEVDVGVADVHVLDEEVNLAVDDVDDRPAVRMNDDAPGAFASRGVVVVRNLIPPRLLRWLRAECDVLSAPIRNLADVDCMVDPLEGIDMDGGEPGDAIIGVRPPSHYPHRSPRTSSIRRDPGDD